MTLEALVSKFNASANSSGVQGLEIDQTAFEIAKLGPRGTQFLLEAYDSADELHARAVLIALASVKPVPPGLSELFTRALNDHRPQVLFAAIESLEAIGERRTFDRIRKYVTHPSSFVRAAAIQYIIGLFPQKALSIVDRGLADESFRVRGAVLDSLDFTDEPELVSRGISVAWRFVGHQHPEDRSAAQLLLEDHYWSNLSPGEIASERVNPDPHIRASALRASAHGEIEKAPEVIAVALSDPDRVVRLNALDEMAELFLHVNAGTLPALPDVAEFFTEEDPVIREAAKDAAWLRERYKHQ
jgi:HEAT repeat protein